MLFSCLVFVSDIALSPSFTFLSHLFRDDATIALFTYYVNRFCNIFYFFLQSIETILSFIEKKVEKSAPLVERFSLFSF